MALATGYQSTAVTAHAIRSWFWAEAFAGVEGLGDVDHELLYVAAMPHDLLEAATALDTTGARSDKRLS